ncbi:hypothetical protein K432DRAFT_410114 [Lepidopterella palustris CBS 459.81]|uniref:Carboxymuconolactone decarboxylase-like domain-containing protein n=1 Tax=Lepidopterella palustris CBS 459.81 TaxID=1314670 RepID=A0A8E2DYP2_9PEZI|nr:hypothetical protein K432DRAFT_410114 [Lepidopterella palustris CBS 459.81]
MRLPYVPNPPQFENGDDQEIVDRVKRRRGEDGLLELDLSLLHSPTVADGWNSFLGSIRAKTTISASIRETAICRVAVLNKAWYEWEQHAPLLRACPNVKEEGIQHILLAAPRTDTHSKKLDGVQGAGIAPLSNPFSAARTTIESMPAALADLPHANLSEAGGEGHLGEGALDEKHLAVIAYTDAMTLDVHVPDVVFERLKQSFTDREVVEITATIAAYNCVSRFLVALDVGERNAQSGLAVY